MFLLMIIPWGDIWNERLATSNSNSNYKCRRRGGKNIGKINVGVKSGHYTLGSLPMNAMAPDFKPPYCHVKT